jgi:glutamate synthase domain-containing protein 2
MADYTNTHIYKLHCLNTDVKEFYIGHTTNPKQRDSCHKDRSKETHCKSNIKLYKLIRDNGGYDNWYMTIIEQRNCNNFYEAVELEQLWIDKLNPELNDHKALITKEQKQHNANEWKRNSVSHHEYNRNYNKNMTEEQKAQKLLKQRERYSNQTREQKDARNAKLKERAKLKDPSGGDKPIIDNLTCLT